MEVICDTASETVLAVLERGVDPKITPETDDNPTTYGGCAKEMYITHAVSACGRRKCTRRLQLVNTLISNSKMFTDGTNHAREEYKQLYLDEFVYRFNRRRSRSALVDGLLNACAQTEPHPLISAGGVKLGPACESL